MSTRWWTLIVWALAAASAVFWGLKLFVAPQTLAVPAPLARTSLVARADLTRLLGVDAPLPQAEEPAADARFHLLGVVAPRGAAAAAQGLALIAIDGKPARAYRGGAVVDGQNVLQKVGPREASLGPRGGAVRVALNIPPPLPAATGTMPAAAPETDAPQPAMPGYTPPQTLNYTPPPMGVNPPQLAPHARRGRLAPQDAPQAPAGTVDGDGASEREDRR
ncbi:MAG: hypothetical protein KGI36_11360 [Burkholderiales bacterium]|nr:hypothetical protein [Burkholderiales bacterium]